jgi:chromosome segregation ATPase
MEFPPEQNKILGSWDQQRDAMLREISILTNEKNTLQKEVNDLGLAHADLQTSVARVQGRIDEIKQAEERFSTSLRTDIADLIVTKSTLESEVEEFRKEKTRIQEEKDASTELLKTIKDIYDFVQSNTDKLYTRSALIIQDSEVASKQLQNALTAVLQSSKEIIDINSKNVTETNIVLDKLPKMLIELQKARLIRHKL